MMQWKFSIMSIFIKVIMWMLVLLQHKILVFGIRFPKLVSGGSLNYSRVQVQ